MCLMICNVLLIDSKIPSTITGNPLPLSVLHTIANNEVIYGDVKADDSIFDPIIDVEKCSHKIVNFEIHNGNLYGDVVVLPTPKGKYLELLNYMSFDFRPRTIGEISNINDKTKKRNYEVVAFDCYFSANNLKEAA
jgi:hypothetical protein